MLQNLLTGFQAFFSFFLFFFFFFFTEYSLAILYFLMPEFHKKLMLTIFAVFPLCLFPSPSLLLMLPLLLL